LYGFVNSNNTGLADDVNNHHVVTDQLPACRIRNQKDYEISDIFALKNCTYITHVFYVQNQYNTLYLKYYIGGGGGN